MIACSHLRHALYVANREVIVKYAALVISTILLSVTAGVNAQQITDTHCGSTTSVGVDATGNLSVTLQTGLGQKVYCVPRADLEKSPHLVAIATSAFSSRSNLCVESKNGEAVSLKATLGEPVEKPETKPVPVEKEPKEKPERGAPDK